MNLNTFRKETALCEIKEGVIENEEAITQFQAKIVNKKYLLRWRFRVCKYCNEGFDIKEHGFGYNCGRC